MNKDEIITDNLERAEEYYHLHPAFEKVFAFLRKDNLTELPTGRHEIDGDRLFCMIDKCPGRSRNEAKLEAHRKFIDIQYIIAGTDEMGSSPIADCKLADAAYDTWKDIEFFNDKPQSWTNVPTGSFIIFFPERAHAPLVSNSQIHKAVVKIAAE